MGGGIFLEIRALGKASEKYLGRVYYSASPKIIPV